MGCGSQISDWSLRDQQERAAGGKRNAFFNHRALGCQYSFQDCVERPTDFEFPPELKVATGSLHSRADHKWQKQRNKRGDSLDTETSLLDFSAQFGAAVAALMHRVFVDGARQKPMLRRRCENAAARSRCPEHLPQHQIILGDVFKNVECSDDIELMLEKIWRASI
jgi:hypothetical protein